MNETLVSILPLVENRDEWKRRALMAEAKLAELPPLKAPPTIFTPYESISTTYSTCATVDGQRADVYGIIKDAALDLLSAMMERGVVVPQVVRGELRLTCHALPRPDAMTKERLAQVVAKMVQG